MAEIEEKMKRLFAILTMSILSTAAYAQSYAEGTIVDVQTIYGSNSYNVPKRICSDVDVPVYRNGNNSNNIITGAIIGGVIGHQFGKGDQRKDNRNAGAIIGGLIGSQNQNGNVVQYRRETQCRTEYQRQEESFISHYIVVINVHGNTIRQQTGIAYNVGDTVRLRVSYSLN